MELSITLIIIVVTVFVSIGAFSSQKIMEDLIFYPPAISQRNQWYRFFSCGLLHADWGHLIFNMFALYLFGQKLEGYFNQVFGEKGKILYLVLYIAALAVSVLPTYFKNRNNYHYRSLGASGAVSAVIFSSILFDPLTGIGLFFHPGICCRIYFWPYLSYYFAVARQKRRRKHQSLSPYFRSFVWPRVHAYCRGNIFRHLYS